jgi:cell division protein FtsB
MTPAPARSRSRSQARPAIAPRGPRRVSGPVSRRMVTAPAGGAALPRRGNTGLFARVRALPEHRVVDRLLRSRLWIWVLGALLGGIVTMQVSLLKLNAGISRAVETTTTLERQNATLEASIARLSAPDKINTNARALGMVLPPAGEVGYLTPGSQDAERAVRRMQPPSDAAAALLANGGIEPGSLAASPVTASTTVTETPVTETPVTETPVTETPVTETPVTETPVDPATTTPPATEAPPVAAGTEQPPATTQTSPAGGVVAGQG